MLANREGENNISVNYVSITATPYAQVISRKDNPIKPEYAYILKPGEDYIGLSNYIDEYQKQNSHIINILSGESNFEKLDNAFCDYLIQCLIYHKNADIFDYAKPRMLINIGTSKEVHNEDERKIKGFLNHFRNNNLRDHEFYNEWKTFDTNKYRLDCSYQEAYEYIKMYILPLVDVLVINSDNNNKIHFDIREEQKFQILIGSKKLERGITIADLTTTYIKRLDNKHTYDTTLQGARWLGYRRKSFDISRLYLTKELANLYYDINNANDEIEVRIESCNKNHQKFSETERFIPIPEARVQSQQGTRDSISPIARVTNEYLYYLMDNRLDNKLNKVNEQFFIRFVELLDKNSSVHYDYPALTFDSLDQFHQQFFQDELKYYVNQPDKQYELIKNKYFNLFDHQCHFETIIDRILSLKDKKVCVRFIFNLVQNPNIELKDIDNPDYPYKERKLTSAINFGNGGYANEIMVYLDDDCLAIDILPLLVWNDEGVSHKIFRAKLFIPQSAKTIRSGIIGK